MLYRFPNMVVAQVTRESVQQAIASGITAQQVAPLGGVAGRRGALGCVVPLEKASTRSVAAGGVTCCLTIEQAREKARL